MGAEELQVVLAKGWFVHRPFFFFKEKQNSVVALCYQIFLFVKG